MKAREIIEKYVKKSMQDKVAIICLLKQGGWFHIHKNEEIDKRANLAIHIK